MSDPFKHLPSTGKIPRSVSAWRELVATAREIDSRKSNFPREPKSAVSFFPTTIVKIANLSGGALKTGDLVKVFPPDAFGPSPAGPKLLHEHPIFPATLPDHSTSSYARVLERIEANGIGEAATLGWAGDGHALIQGESRPAHSQRKYAGCSIVGIPYLMTGAWKLYNWQQIAYPSQVVAPFEGVPINPGTTFDFQGVESFVQFRLNSNLIEIRSRYAHQFRGVFALTFGITRDKAALRDAASGRSIGWGYPGLTVNSQVRATNAVTGQVENLSGIVSTTLNPFWLSRHPSAFKVGEFDANFAYDNIPQFPLTMAITQTLPFSSFHSATFADPGKWNYRWKIHCWIGGQDMPSYSRGTVEVRPWFCSLELMETQRDETIIFSGNSMPTQPPSPGSVSGGGGSSGSGRLPSPLEGAVAAGTSAPAVTGIGVSAFQRLGQANLSTGAAKLTGSG